MSGLVISLKPNEKFLVNGALLANGNKRSQICVPGDDVFILRMSDAIHPQEVNTPIQRLYYSVQLILSQDSKVEDLNDEIIGQIDTLLDVLSGTPVEQGLRKAKASFLTARYYSVLYALKSMLDFESELLSRNGGITMQDMSDAAEGYQPAAQHMSELAIPAE